MCEPITYTYLPPIKRDMSLNLIEINEWNEECVQQNVSNFWTLTSYNDKEWQLWQTYVKTKTPVNKQGFLRSGRWEIRTPDICLVRAALWPAELNAQFELNFKTF